MRLGNTFFSKITPATWLVVGVMPLLVFGVSPVALIHSASAQVVVLDDLATASAEDIVATRQSNFRGNGRAMKAISDAVKSGDLATVAAAAGLVADWAEIMSDYFPPNTAPRATAGAFKNDAEAAIWENWEDFVGLANNSATAARRLASLAAAGDTAGVAGGLRELGATCGACHRKYRK